tara:strand:- start:9246 stop:10172 length:927 start_codon:yes stop_codon:yes gene_type:complete
MISIVIPVWKTLYLARTIESVLEQTFTDFELIVVEGRRLPEFDRIMSAYQDSRIQIHRHDPMPVVENWDQCMGYAKGQFSILLCDDDMFAPKHLEGLVNLSLKYPKVDVFHSRIKFIDDEDGLVDISPMCGEYETAGDFMYQKLRYLRPQFVSDFMYRTSRFRELGGFVDRPMAWYTDADTSFAMAIPHGIAYSKAATFLYRSSDENISSNLEPEQALEAVRQHYDSLLVSITLLPPGDVGYCDLIQTQAAKSRGKAYAQAYTRTCVGRYPFAPLVYAIRLRKRYPISITRAILASVYAFGQKKNLKA